MKKIFMSIFLASCLILSLNIKAVEIINNTFKNIKVNVLQINLGIEKEVEPFVLSSYQKYYDSDILTFKACLESEGLNYEFYEVGDYSIIIFLETNFGDITVHRIENGEIREIVGKKLQTLEFINNTNKNISITPFTKRNGVECMPHYENWPMNTLVLKPKEENKQNWDQDSIEFFKINIENSKDVYNFHIETDNAKIIFSETDGKIKINVEQISNTYKSSIGREFHISVKEFQSFEHPEWWGTRTADGFYLKSWV